MVAIDLDKSGNPSHVAQAYLGPTLGLTNIPLIPARLVTTAGTTSIDPGDSVILVDIAAAVTINLPDVTAWVKQSLGRPATGFERALWIKDLGGNASTFNITVHPFGGQLIDKSGSDVTINVNFQLLRLYPLFDLSGWYIESGVAVSGTSISFIQAGAGAVARTMQNKARERISVADFGAAPGASAAVNNAAFGAALTLVATGGKVYIPGPGTYALSATLNIPSGIVFEGDGYLTILDFTTQGVGPALNFTTKNNIHFRNFQVHNALVAAFFAGPGGGLFGVGHVFENVTGRFGRSGASGFSIQDSFNLTFIGCDGSSNTGAGFALGGFNTTVHLDQCEADSNTLSGYDLNGVVYSTMTACGADANSQYGYSLQNIGGLVLNGCGAETNTLGAIVALASTAIGVGKLVPDIRGVVINGWFGLGNGTSGGASSFLECSSLNSKLIDITIDNCYDFTSPNTISIIANGSTTIKKIGGTFAGVFNLFGLATINALADAVPATDTVPYFTSAKAVAVTALTTFARTLIDDPDAVTARSTLGTPTGTSGAVLPFLNGTNTWSGLQTFDSTGAFATPAVLQATDDGATAGPFILVRRISTTPAANDDIGAFAFQGRNGAAANFNYAQMLTTILDPTTGSEDARFTLQAAIAGASTSIFTMGPQPYFPNHATTASAANAFLNSASSPVGELLRSTSSLRYKRDVEPLDPKLAEAALQLAPIWYRSKCKGDNQSWSWYGLGAEDVAAIDPRLVHWSYAEEDYNETIEQMPDTVEERVRLVKVLDEDEGEHEVEEITRDVTPGALVRKRVLKDGAQLVPDGVMYERVLLLQIAALKARIEELEKKLGG